MPGKEASCVLAYHMHATPTGGGQWSYGAQRPGAEQFDQGDALLQGTFYPPLQQFFFPVRCSPILFMSPLVVAGVYLKDPTFRVPAGVRVLSKSLGKGIPYRWESSEIKV